MYPVIIQIGPVIVYTLWLFVGIAFIAGVFIFTYLAKKKRLNMGFIYNHSFAIFLFTIIGARLFFVLSNFQLYFPEFSPQSLLSVLYIWDKGLSLTGAIAGLVFSIVYYSYRNNEQTTKWLDILIISIIAAMGIGHIGTFLDGSFYGKETDLPWGMVFESPSIKYAVPIHPVQLYAAIFSFLIAFILYIIYKKNIYRKGIITITGILSYFSMVFLLGFLRGDDVMEFLFLRIEQWFSLLILVITGSYIIYRYNKDKKLKLKKE